MSLPNLTMIRVNRDSSHERYYLIVKERRKRRKEKEKHDKAHGTQLVPLDWGGLVALALLYTDVRSRIHTRARYQVREMYNITHSLQICIIHIYEFR